MTDPNSSVINFQTRLNNNLAIDYIDPNYFASSSLNEAGYAIWDRRVAGRSTASPVYLEAFDEGDVTWGAVLHIKQAIDFDKNVSIKQLRFSRERRGALGILSTAGELKVVQTKKEYVEPDSSDDVAGGPELLVQKTSYNLASPYFDPDHKTRYEDRIVSFDWMNLGTPDLEARVVALRANGSFEVLQLPDATAGQLSQFVPVKPPHRRRFSLVTFFTDQSLTL